MNDAELRSVSFELNLCAGQMLTLLAPIIAVEREPIPTLSIWFFCIVGIFSATKLHKINETNV